MLLREPVVDCPKKGIKISETEYLEDYNGCTGDCEKCKKREK